jgi:hypothetical protein
MNAIDYIRLEMGMSKGWIGGLLDDIQDAPMTVPTLQGGNHPLWIVGHLAYSEANILKVYILGKGNPLVPWKDKFSIGSQPVNDAAAYPTFGELKEKFEAVRADTLAYLEAITEADLGKPSHAPDDKKAYFGTIGQCLAVMTTHLAFHGGQVADARRAAGREILMA